MNRVFPPSRKPVNRYTATSILKLKEFLYFFVIQTGSDHAKSAYYRRTADSHVGLAGYVIKVEPLAAFALNYSLGSEDHAVIIGLGEGFKSRDKLFAVKLLCCFCAEGREHFIRMVVMVIVAAASAVLVMIVVVMLVIVAVALLVMIVMVMLVIVTVALLVMIVVVMLVIVAVALLVMIVMVMLVIVAMALLVMIVVMMLVIVAVALLIMIVVVMLVVVTVALLVMIVVVMMMLFLDCLYKMLESIGLLHSCKDVLTVKVLPGRSNDSRLGIMLTDKSYALLYLMLLYLSGVGEDYTGCVCNLIVVELAEVLHIHFALARIGNGGKAVELSFFRLYLAYCLDNVGKLTDARGLNDYSVGAVLRENLTESLGKVAYKRAADTARIHLGNLYARIGKEAAVDTDLAEFVLDENYLLTDKSLGKKLLYKRSFSRAEKAGENINFRHNRISF